MAVPTRAAPEDDEQGDDGDEFTFPTPPPPLPLGFGARGKGFHRSLCSSSASSSPPAWLLSSPIRRSFSAADCAASPWRDRVLLARQGRQRLEGGRCSPALSDCAGGFCGEDEEEERMDSLWEDLNDADADAAARGEDLFRSVAGAGPGFFAADRAASVGKDALRACRSSRQRPPGLVVMMRALKRLFVAHKGRSRVHRDERSTASASSLSRKG